MKLKYRFLFPSLIAIAIVLMIFGSLLLLVSFKMQFESERDGLNQRLQSAAYALEASYTNYALQNMDVSEDRIYDIAADQGVELIRTDGDEQSNSIRLHGHTLCAEGFLSLGESSYLLIVESDLNELFAQREYLLKWYYVSYIAAILFMTITMFLITGKVTQTLSEITATSVALAKGDLSCRTFIQTDDEIGQLAFAFDRMSDELTDQLARQSQFINDLTHEIKTPLTAMIGHAEKIRSGRMNEESTLIAAQTILREGKRLDALTLTLREWILLKQEMPNMGSLSARFILEMAIDAFSESIQKIYIAENAEDTVVFGNKALLIALITNLIRNAQNAGATNIELNCKVASDALGSAESAESDAVILLTVSDNGCGMGEEDLLHVTEPFYRVDKARSRETGGIGLGLTLCNEIAQIHGAKLSLTSKLGQGTKATLQMSGRQVQQDE